MVTYPLKPFFQSFYEELQKDFKYSLTSWNKIQLKQALPFPWTDELDFFQLLSSLVSLFASQKVKSVLISNLFVDSISSWKKSLFYIGFGMLLTPFIQSAWLFFLNHLIFMDNLLLIYYNRYIGDDRESYAAGQCHGKNTNFKCGN